MSTFRYPTLRAAMAVAICASAAACQEPIAGDPTSYVLYANPVTAIMVANGAFAPKPIPVQPAPVTEHVKYLDHRTAEYFGMDGNAFGQRMVACFYYHNIYTETMLMKRHGDPENFAILYVEQTAARDTFGLDPITATNAERSFLRIVDFAYNTPDTDTPDDNSKSQFVYDSCIKGELL